MTQSELTVEIKDTDPNPRTEAVDVGVVADMNE